MPKPAEAIAQARSHEDAARSKLAEALELARLVQSWREELRDTEARLRKAREDLEQLEVMARALIATRRRRAGSTGARPGGRSGASEGRARDPQARRPRSNARRDGVHRRGRSRAGWSKERVGCNLSSQSLYLEVEPELEARERRVAPVRAIHGRCGTDLPLPQSSRGSWAIVPVRRHVMSIHAGHRQPSWWLLTLAATLALAPGCSGDPVPAGELRPLLEQPRPVSYEYVPKNPPAIEAPTAASSASLDVWLRQQGLWQGRNRRRMDTLAYQDMRRQREELRTAAGGISTLTGERSQNRREQRLQQQGQYRAHLQQSSQWFEGQRLRAAAESARWREVSMTIDAHLQNQR